MVSEIKINQQIIAIIIRSEFNENGIHFFTPDSFSQQLGYMKRGKGYVIPPHVHNPVKREVLWTQEVLFIKSGKVRVDFYDNKRNYIKSTILETGDVILLASGGHGFKMLEESEIYEVKQGPYCGEQDKSRFPSVNDNDLNLIIDG